MIKYYIAMDIGCIECGEGSKCIGIFSTKEAAEKSLIEPEKQQKTNWSGEHSFEVIEGEFCDQMAKN